MKDFINSHVQALWFIIIILLCLANFDFSQAGINGEDIRFTDPDDTPLYFEIECWDSTNEMAEVWVGVPRITLGTVDM